MLDENLSIVDATIFGLGTLKAHQSTYLVKNHCKNGEIKISKNIIEKFPNKIKNIHPSLLPAYGGKGMYGMNVHNKVIENSERESGITIHYVNKNYDEGKIIFQKKLSY